MIVHQFYDEGLAHASYAVLSDKEIALIDPGRDPMPYLSFAKEHGADIKAVLETHPHADFVSSHLEFHDTFDIPIYANPRMGPFFEYTPLDDGNEIHIGEAKIRAIYTPGHSPDHNSYLLIDEEGEPYGIFTGDSLFVGDVGRPDLREDAGNFNLKKEELANQMYETMQRAFKPLPDEVKVYPAHGAGSLCGKNMSEETISTIGKERKNNWSFQEEDRQAFVEELLSGQPNVPPYFPFDVEENRKGVSPYKTSLQKVPRLAEGDKPEEGVLTIDTRPSEAFKEGHFPDALNIPDGAKFETWLGTLVEPETEFYLLSGSKEELQAVLEKTAKIGYERFIKGAKVMSDEEKEDTEMGFAGLEEVREHPEKYTIVDVRAPKEVEEQKPFEDSINIPLSELMERADEVPEGKPVAVHCSGGYRSAIAASILEKQGRKKVLDIGEQIEELLS